MLGGKFTQPIKNERSMFGELLPLIFHSDYMAEIVKHQLKDKRKENGTFIYQRVANNILSKKYFKYKIPNNFIKI